MDDDVEYVIPAAEVERIENERYRRWPSIPGHLQTAWSGEVK
jgi:hypothetical protein